MARSELAAGLDPERPVFIIGGSRTGSEMLKTMLSASQQIDFVDELFLYCPRWLHKDLSTNIEENVGRLDSSTALDALMDFLYSGTAYGWFWSVIERELDREALRAELSKNTLDYKSLLNAIMTVHSRTRGKSGLGAKFPMHYSLTDKLITWYPNCRLIHTTRNPKDVFASQAAKYISNEQTRLAKNLSRFKQFVHINLQTTWTAHWHVRLRELPNYRLVRYEDVVTEPEATTRSICEFLQIPFTQEMLEPNQYGSSFGNEKDRRGVDSNAVGRWRQRISRPAALYMDMTHQAAYKALGYSGADE